LVGEGGRDSAAEDADERDREGDEVDDDENESEDAGDADADAAGRYISEEGRFGVRHGLVKLLYANTGARVVWVLSAMVREGEDLQRAHVKDSGSKASSCH
jgi:hypothetical protein